MPEPVKTLDPKPPDPKPPDPKPPDKPKEEDKPKSASASMTVEFGVARWPEGKAMPAKFLHDELRRSGTGEPKLALIREHVRANLKNPAAKTALATIKALTDSALPTNLRLPDATVRKAMRIVERGRWEPDAPPQADECPE